MLQPQRQIGAPIHRFQQLLVLRTAFDIYAGAQQFRRALRPFGHALQPPLGRFHRAHGRVIASHHELAKGLATVQPHLAQHFDPLVDDGLISLGRAKAKGELHRKAFQFRRDRQQGMQGLFRGSFVAVHFRHQRRKRGVKRIQPRRQLAGPHQPQHRHRAVGFNLTQPLHDAANAPRARAGAHKDCKAHVACRIDAEIACDNGRAIDNAADSQAFRHKPIFKLGHHACFILGQVFHPDQNRRQPRARRRCHPVNRKHPSLCRIKRAIRKAGGKGGIGHEFGMAFPFQFGATNRTGKMRGVGLRMCRGVPIQQRQQMRPVGGTVAVGGIQGFLDRDIGRYAGAFQRRKRPGVQLIHQGISQRMVGNGGHGRGFRFRSRGHMAAAHLWPPEK